MDFFFKNKACTGLMVVMPENERLFLDDMKEFNFPESRSLKLKEVMGYDKHRVVKSDECVSDLAVFGLEKLFDDNLLSKDDIDGLVVVTQSPDYFMPATSSVIQGKLELKEDIFCMDIPQGCAGFIVGLMQSFMMLDQKAINKVVLINGDVISRKVSTKDRNSYPLIGDAVSIAIIENKGDQKIFCNLKMDGMGRDALKIPAGGFRTPSSNETAQLVDIGDNNLRAKDHLVMDGAAVFNFVQTKVPPMINQLIKSSGVSKNEIDYFAFHQPNKFMLQKLADKLEIPYEKMPSNIVENFGNSSGVTIPSVLAYNLNDKLLESELSLCLAGFGVGLTWGSILMKMGNLDFCKIVDY
jgi:3-oxoacyl-[acyl-carrier-protein] synthase-3